MCWEIVILPGETWDVILDFLGRETALEAYELTYRIGEVWRPTLESYISHGKGPVWWFLRSDGLRHPHNFGSNKVRACRLIDCAVRTFCCGCAQVGDRSS